MIQHHKIWHESTDVISEMSQGGLKTVSILFAKNVIEKLDKWLILV